MLDLHCRFTSQLAKGDSRTGSFPRRSRLRFSFHYRSDGERIAEGYAMFDLPALFAQWGIDLYARAGGAADWVHDIRA